VSILVTGAAGFIGSRLCRALLERGDCVVGLDNFDPYYARQLKELHLRDLLDWPNFSFVELDVRDEAGVFELFRNHGFEALAHIAAMAAVRYSVRNPALYGSVNVQGTTNLLDAARQTSRPRCVLASTGGVYGRDTPLPFDEKAPAVHPLAPYPASKRSMELFAHSFAHLFGLQTTILRFFNVYGPHGRPDMMPWQWTRNIARGEPITLFDQGRLKRDWTFGDDITRGFLLALDRPFDWEIINLGGGAPIENALFVGVIESLLGQAALVENAPTPLSEPLETWANIEKAARLLGWKPEVGVEEGLSRFVEWMREEGLL
jgi:UDP-glucuronate 4-epimerase